MKIITVANNKGGVGKTMQCYQLACHLAHKGHKVLAIDLDSQANLSSTFCVQIERTLIPEWLIGDVAFEDILVPSQGKGSLHQNISLIPASRHLANLSKLLIMSEGEIRKNIVENDLVDCMVALPSQLFYNTMIPACLWFVTRDKKDHSFRDRRGQILFIDARNMGVMIDRRHRELTDEDVKKISSTYHSWRGENKLKYEDIYD